MISSWSCPNVFNPFGASVPITCSGILLNRMICPIGFSPEVKRLVTTVCPSRHTFADARRKPNATTDKYVSLINRASIAALEEAMGVPVDPLRFRANVYFDGAAAWTEHDWVESEIAIGAARLRVISPITRCAATQVNPATATRDLDIVTALGRAFGHINMGVYAEVVAGGEITPGDLLVASYGS